MAQLLNSFNPMDYDPSQGGASWPLGKHPVVIESAEVMATNDNNSGKLVLSLKIFDGPNAGFTGKYNLNLYNQSAKAAEIAHRQLSAICHVTQTFQLGQDGTQLQFLFNKPFVVEVGYQKGEEPGPNNPDAKGYTEIKRVFDMNGIEPGKNGAAQQPQQAPQGFGGGQPAAQPQQPAQQGGANAWNGNGGGGNAPAANGGGGSWNGGGNAPAANNTPNPGNAGGASWSQNQGGSGAPQGGNGGPSWGQRNG